MPTVPITGLLKEYSTYLSNLPFPRLYADRDAEQVTDRQTDLSSVLCDCGGQTYCLRSSHKPQVRVDAKTEDPLFSCKVTLTLPDTYSSNGDLLSIPHGHVKAHACTYEYRYAFIFPSTYAYIDTYIHTYYIPTYIQTYTYVHTYSTEISAYVHA